jgi:hypothetical protein
VPGHRSPQASPSHADLHAEITKHHLMRIIIMSMIVKAGLAALLLATGLSAAAAGAPRYPHDDPWVQQLHLDNDAVPAKQYFEEMQRDGH